MNDDAKTMPARVRPRPMRDVAFDIAHHLARFAADPSINMPETVATTSGPLPMLYGGTARAEAGGVQVSYRPNSYGDHLCGTEANEYLAWLNAGNVGKHSDMPVFIERVAAAKIARIERAKRARATLIATDWSTFSDEEAIKIADRLTEIRS